MNTYEGVEALHGGEWATSQPDRFTPGKEPPILFGL
jgi:hypothetical protein